MMRIVETVKELRATVSVWQRAGETVALVPTMGYLHDAHLALVDAGFEHSDRTIVSIFVNQKQFGPDEDFKTYPRKKERDLQLLEAQGVDLAFLPSETVMYPPGFSARIDVPAFSDKLCAIERPNHFSGVATVCTKLLLQCMPNVAVFGEKDYQQLQIIRQLVKDLNINVSICGVPTVREKDGLAMSSRNVYLSASERVMASQINVILSNSAQQLSAGTAPVKELKNAHQRFTKLIGNPPEYLQLCDAQNLRIVEEVVRPARLLTAVTIGKTRLIDNWPVTPVLR
jgi:pantoate--beta-alanine ligase